MNSNQIRAFKKLVKEYKFSETSHIVEKKIGMNYGMFLSKCEPLFIMSRIRSCVTDTTLLLLIDRIHSQWLNVMIRNRWSQRLDNLVNEYGQQPVKDAIIDLSKENLWGFIAGEKIEYNYEEVATHYLCTELVGPRIDLLNETKALKKELCEVNETNQPSEDKPIDSTLLEDDEAITPSSDTEDEEPISRQAQKARERITLSLGNMQNDFFIIGKFFQLCAESGDAAHQTQRLQEELDNLNRRLQAAQLLANRSDEEIDRLKEIIRQKEDENTRLLSELEKAKEANPAPSPSIPTKKIIPESKLRELVAVGDKMIRQLTPFLAQYDIIVNPHK